MIHFTRDIASRKTSFVNINAVSLVSVAHQIKQEELHINVNVSTTCLALFRHHAWQMTLM